MVRLRLLLLFLLLFGCFTAAGQRGAGAVLATLP